REGPVSGRPALVAHTGYTGEDGWEVYCSATDASTLWDAILDTGAPFGIMPAGLGARDTLRLERALPLYGHELTEETTPLEAGLEWVTKLSKESFLGREALLKMKQEGIRRRLVGLELVEPGIARSHYPILKQDRPIGEVT